MEQPVPEEMCPIEEICTGAVCEERQPIGRIDTGEV